MPSKINYINENFKSDNVLKIKTDYTETNENKFFVFLFNALCHIENFHNFLNTLYNFLTVLCYLKNYEYCYIQA